MNKSVLAVVLGGGKGTRLYPLTANRSKPAVPIAGKYRLVDIPISNCINSKINRIYVLTQFNSASLNKHIKQTYAFDSFTKGFVDILAAEQTISNANWYQGTADAVRQSLQHLLSHDFDYMLILSGDQLYHMDFDQMLEFHYNNKADLTIATLPVNAKEATSFGIMKTNSEGEIISFIEKPSNDQLGDWKSDTSENAKSEGKEFLASMGIYLFNRSKLEEVLAFDESQTDFGKDIIPKMVNGEDKVIAYQYEGYWTDIGTIDSFFEANLDLTSDVPHFNLFDNRRLIYTRARMLPPAKISGSQLKNTMISEGSLIFSESINQSLIGIRTRIGKGTKISNCYIMGADFFESLQDLEKNKLENIPSVGIGENCYLHQVIVDKNARIGNNVTIIGDNEMEDFETEQYCVRDGIIIVKKNSIIQNDEKIGKV